MTELLPFRPWTEHAIERMLTDTEQIMFVDAGGGKTRALLEAFRLAREYCDSERLLVIAPMKVAANVWPAEIEKWGFEFTHQVLTTKTEEVEDVDVWLVHFEALPWLFGKPDTKRRRWISGAWDELWNGAKPDWLHIDEIHHLKVASGVRAKTLARYAEDFARRTGGTASPAANGYEGLHGILKAVDLGVALGSVDPRDDVWKNGITRFRRQYFDAIEGYGGRRNFTEWELKDGAAAEIQDAIRPRVTCVTSADWAEDLPNVETYTIPIELPPHAREAYQLMKDEAIMEAGGRELLFAEEATNTKLRQICNGHVYTDQGWERRTGAYETLHTEKIDALLAHLYHSPPIIVVYEFKHDKAEIEAALRGCQIDYATLDGVDDYEVIRRWNRGELRVLLMYPAEGLNLQEGGNHIMWFNPPYDWLKYDQMNRRLVRLGQSEDTVYVHHLSATNTIEQRVSAMLRDKEAEEGGLKEALS